MKRIKQNIRQFRKLGRRIVRGWRQQDRRWGLWWRAGNGLLAAIILAGVVIPIAQQLVHRNDYTLSADTLKLVGTTDHTLTKQMTYDAQTQTYQFNQAAVQGAGGQAGVAGALAAMRAQVGTASGHGSDKSLYALDVPQDFAKGVTYTDTNTGLNFSLVPQFRANTGQAVGGHLVFPVHGSGTQAIYTLKNNGLKEDIVVQKATGDTLTFSYKLSLPATLEAKVIPGSNGSIGIYSADPSLYGNISYGGSTDQASVQRARVNSPKTNLVFGLPSPVIKNTAGQEVGSARFALQGSTLQVVASGLSDVNTPFTVDPSVVVTAASDFAGGNNEDNIDFSTSGQITRGGLTGGSVGSWTATSAFTQPSSGLATAVYNGYMYLLSGGVSSGTYTSSVQYAPITTSTGAVGAWHYTHSSTDDGTTFVSGFSGPVANFGVAVYNGYLYIAGGGNSSSVSSTVQYAPLNANGTVGAWSSTTSMNTTRFSFGFGAYNGYLYAYGGCTSVSLGACSGYSKTLEYAPINANGTAGSWTISGNNMTTTRINMEGAIYNGYLYAMGGCVSISLGNCTSQLSSVEYASINSDGTVGTWKTTTSFTTSRQNFGAVAANGYLYIMGGSTTLNDVQYAPIYTNGTLGTWSTTTAFTTARFGLAVTASNGYVYLAGGCSSNATNCGSGLMNDVQYAKIDPAPSTPPSWSGPAGAWTTSANSFANARSNHQTVAYNGYLYVMGGTDPTAACTGSAGSCADVQYAPINRDGSIGTWQATSSFASGRTLFSAVAFNGYLYVMGGEAGAATIYNDIQYAQINATGTLSTWTTSPHTLTGRYGLTASAFNGYIYVLGGCTAISLGACSAITGSVQYAALSPTDGSVGTWAAATSLPAARYSPESVTYGGYVYIMGGCTTYANTGNVCNAYTNDVSYAAINANGTLGTWQATSAFTTGRYLFGATAYNGFLYLHGGSSASTGYMNDAQYAAINSNGTLGTWQATSAFTTGRYGLGSATYNGYLYLTGGCTGNALNCGSGLAKADTQYAPLQSIPRIAHYSKLIDLGFAVNVTGVTYNGTPGGAVSVSYRAAGTNGVFGSAAPVSNITSSGCTSNVASTRYVLLSVTLDDSYGLGTGGGFPDSTSTAANLTDLTVNYSTGHPPPNIRLRGGQTLQAGTLSSLDTCS